MSSPFDDSPEDLVRLRTTVHDWLKISRHALETFYRDDNSFWLDSNVKKQQENSTDDHLSLTTTARSYMALANADRLLSKGDEVAPPDWVSKFLAFCEEYRDSIKIDDKGLKEIYYSNKGDDQKRQTNFDLAHVADLVFVLEYIERFYPSVQQDVSSLKNDTWQKLCARVKEILTRSFSDIKAPNTRQNKSTSKSDDQKFTKLENIEGQIFLENSREASRHYFVTLHSLRALGILNPKYLLTSNNRKKLAEFILKFCAEQCFYAQRKNRHQQDPFRLTFAMVIYCVYAQHVDKDLCVAIIEALSAAQQENGNWPATHPIIRGQNNRPWHVTSHEIALCLTWLYFQPRLPDSARPLLLGMMERYLTNWVIPTFVRVPIDNGKGSFEGWFDDHTITYDFTASWATAIVCHFLANYHSVLDDHINRRVIETLGLQASSSKFLIDETEHERSLRWWKPLLLKRATKRKGPWHSTWPDIPPFAWSFNFSEHDVTRRLSWNWTDPLPNNKISSELTAKVILPIIKKPGGRPEKDMCSGLLPGEPGTRKTSLVKEIANILEWPVVIVPASVIFERGFDFMEARASNVFQRLSYLTGCVIFFDEFEEFFRDRNDSDSSIHDRTIAAFTTSAMLPRLQDLHDAGRCLIFLATNDEHKIDPAIKRPGRIDFRIPIVHPRCERILEYLRAPTRQTLEASGLHVDNSVCTVAEEDQEQLNFIIEAVEKAVCRLFDPEEEVRFAFVEEAFKAAARFAGPGKKTERKNAALTSLKRSRKHAHGSNGGPPNLWDQ